MRSVTADDITFAVTVPGTDHLVHEVGGRLVADDPSVEFTTIAPGIWDLTRADRRPALDRFAERYAAVRAAEGRELSPEATRRLPDIDPTHPLADAWRLRAASYRHLVAALSTVVAASTGHVDHVVDVGAGSGWLAARFAQRGWTAAAIDVTVEGADGLARAREHAIGLLLARAEMEAMPFASNTVDLVVFNASLHYAADVTVALAEAHRVVRPRGTIAVLDSPVFTDPHAGQRSVAEFADHVRATYGIEAAPLEGPGFLRETDLAAFATTSGCSWHRSGVETGLRGRYQAWRGARIAGRETATRPLLIARLPEDR